MTRSEKARLKRLKALERTSSADLEALLLLDFQSQETGEAEIDEILCAAEILAQRGPRQDDAQADRAWEVFQEKYLPFADGSALHESAEALGASATAVQPRPAPSLRRRMRRLALRYPVFCRIAQAAACLALCLLLSGSLVLLFSPQARSSFSGWVRELRGDHLEYRYAAPDDPDTASAEGGVMYRPAWLPEGCRLTNVSELGDETAVMYDGGGDCDVVFQYLPASAGSFSIYAEGPYQAVTVAGGPADLYPAPEPGMTSILIWGDTEAELLMSLLAPLPPEDLLRIAESVRPVAAEPPPNRPLWCPEDYTLQSDGGGPSGIGASYRGGEDQLLRYAFAVSGSFQWETAQADIQAATAGLEAEEVLLDAAPARLYHQSDGTTHLVWTNGLGDLYWLYGPLADTDLVKMAESVIMGA